jgi:hypothetical protein
LVAAGFPGDFGQVSGPACPTFRLACNSEPQFLAVKRRRKITVPPTPPFQGRPADDVLQISGSLHEPVKDALVLVVKQPPRRDRRPR